MFVALPAADRGRRSYQQRRRSLRFPEAIIGACKCKGRTEAALNGAAPVSEEHTLQRTGTRRKRLGKVEGGRGNANSRMSMFPSLRRSLWGNKLPPSAGVQRLIFRGHTRGGSKMGSNAQDNCEVVCDPHDLACYSFSRQANILSCVSSSVYNTFDDRAPAAQIVSSSTSATNGKHYSPHTITSC